MDADAAAASLEAVQISRNVDAKLRKYALDLEEALKGNKASLARARAANDADKVAKRLKTISELEQLVAYAPARDVVLPESQTSIG